MCTLSFVPRERGYVIAMNRDERTTRSEALPPKIFRIAGKLVAYPHESTGGTWIGSNDHGLTLALLNRGDSSGPKQRSRGEIIPALIGAETIQEVGARLHGMHLSGVLPFRLIAISGRERRLGEWLWDGRSLEALSFPWRPRHWFSSGLSDENARKQRLAVCRAAWRRPTAGTLAWLRRLHRSHRPERGPFSVCVHRPDAHTRSYTEIVVRPGGTVMRYRPGSPCAARPFRRPVALPSAA